MSEMTVQNKVAIIYGSQTGQSKSIAENIASLAVDKGILGELMSMEESLSQFPFTNFSLCVVVTSSTGDGDPPDNAIGFWRKLRKADSSSSPLSHLRFALLGLGDTNYSNFCAFPKTVDRKLLELGARRFYPSGYADDAVGLENVVEPWIDGLFPSIKRALTDETYALTVEEARPDTITTEEMVLEKSTEECLPDLEPVSIIESSNEEILNVNLVTLPNPLLKDVDLKVPVLPQSYLTLSYSLSFSDFDITRVPRQNSLPYPSAAGPVIEVTVESSRVLTHPEAVKTAIEINLKFTGINFTYEPGDSFAVLCPNPDPEVERLIRLLNISENADLPVALGVAQELAHVKVGAKCKFQVPPHLPTTATLRFLLLHCCEICSVPKKAFLRVMAEHALSETEKRRLLELSSIQGSDDYTKLLREPNLNIVDLLEHFPTCRLPVERLLEHLPRLAPRPYSFSSSPLVNNDRGTFVFNVVEFPATSGRVYQRKGVATGWLQKLTNPVNDSLEKGMANMNLNEVKIPIYLRTGTTFRLPENPSVPIIMIGPGTGVAPFVGFLLHREQILKRDPGVDFGTSWLFFGCRRRDRDYLYKEELERLFNVGILNRLHVCFSRENVPNKPKYVQELIKQHRIQLIRLIDKGAYVYVCGDATNMSKDVMNAFVSAVRETKNLAEDEAMKFVLSMMTEKRYLQDIWT